jgi:hypothetical protein
MSVDLNPVGTVEKIDPVGVDRQPVFAGEIFDVSAESRGDNKRAGGVRFRDGQAPRFSSAGMTKNLGGMV